ncbi:MAG: OB-fold putative lipoprotein [Flavobacteriales bacterium]|nr:OB-fold putative lipoprotein [Flavobacteriales bacterium]
MSKTKIILIILLIMGLIGGGTVIYLFNKPHRTAEDEKPFAVVSANDLFVEFSTNESAAFEKYRDKVIQVNGVVEEVKTDASGNTDIVLTTEDILGKVICTLKQGEKAESINTGMTVDLKGICNGYLSDVLLNQGVLVKEKE